MKLETQPNLNVTNPEQKAPDNKATTADKGADDSGVVIAVDKETKNIHQAEIKVAPEKAPKEKDNSENPGFINKLLAFIKGLIPFANKKPQEVNAEIEAQLSPEMPKVEIFDQKLDLDFIEANKDHYVFLLSGNLSQKAGRFGQSSLLRVTKVKYPDSIVEVPVTLEPAHLLDPQLIPSVSYKEKSDKQVDKNISYIEAALNSAIQKAQEGKKSIMLLRGGYGTGGARMYANAPKNFKGMAKLFKEKFGVKFMVNPKTSQYVLVDNSSKPEEQMQTNTNGTQKQNNPLWITDWSAIDHAKSNAHSKQEVVKKAA